MTGPRHSLPERLGGSWEDFVANWCSGNAPGYDRAIVIEALNTVDDLWPESIDRTLHAGSRGSYPASAIIELGILLRLVRSCEGFPELLARLKQGTQGAHAELVTAGTFVDSGLHVRLAVSCEGRVPDLAIDVSGVPVFVEVTSPLESADSFERRRLMLELTDRLRSSGDGFVIHIEFFDEPTQETVDRLVEKLPLETSGEWIALGEAVRFSRVAAPSSEATDFSVQWPHIDRRTERILRRECEQLSRRCSNILVVDMGAMAGSTPDWLEAIARLLQPTKNRRLGAVALYQSLFSAHLTRGYRLWWVVVNSHASHPIPHEVLDALRRSDERARLLLGD